MEGLRDEMQRLQEQLRREQRKPEVSCMICAFVGMAVCLFIYLFYLLCFLSKNPFLVNHMRPVPTKWETSGKISFPSYYHVHVVQSLSFKMIYDMSGLLPHLGSKTYYFFEKFLCFLLISDMFSEPTCHSFCENRSHMVAIKMGDLFWF